MNYTSEGIKNTQSSMTSFGTKLGKKFILIIVRILLISIISVGIIGCAAGIGVFKGIIDTSPEIDNIDVTPTGFSTFIYDKQGNQTAKLVASDSNRIPVSWDKIPENLAHAFVALEDERFYSHNGIDIKGIMRAGVTAVQSRNLSQGASTITQQLLKNNVFTSWTSENSTIDKVKRKIQEQYLAIQLEKTMPKNDILLNYMNTINLGQNTLGVQAASLRYFNKNVYELNLSECAVIASITQNPSRYNPISHPDYNKERRDKALRNMLEQGYIDQKAFDDAMSDDVYSRIQNNNDTVDDSTINSYFDDAVTEAVYNDLLALGYNETQAYTLLYSGGLAIYSTQDPDIQKICNNVTSDPETYPEGTRYLLRYSLSVERANGDVENFSSEMFKRYFKETSNANFNMLFPSPEDAYTAIEEYQNYVMNAGDSVIAENVSITPQPQISLTIEDQSTGEVVAMIGGRGAKEASRTLNRATSTTRQPGSTFKVVSTYAPALDSAGFSLATTYNDAPYNYVSGTPVHNWYSGYRGINSLRDGIRDSLNIVTVKCLTDIGPQLGYDYLLNFGITTLESGKEMHGMIYSDIQQSLALGGITNGVTNMELNAAYACIANQGTYIKPKLYTKVVDHDGNVILDNTPNQTRQVLKPTTAYLLTSAMQDVVTSGTGGSVNFGNMAIAGKTGTTSDYNDVWFAGYTPYYTATTWAGFDNNTKLSSSSEKNLAKTVWKAVMKQVHENLEYETFPVPGGLVSATVCGSSGKLPVPGLCDGHLKTELFEEGTVPSDHCTVHYAGTVCAYSMLPACDTCPFRAEGVFELPLPESPAVASGSAGLAGLAGDGSTGTVITNEDGSTMTMCPHNAFFMADPNSATIIQQQMLEMQMSADAAAAALAAAAAETSDTGGVE
ncbi:MAG: PBP1A family penicillin-binding protein [Lachnospiraceae bacterium]|nr:PBP1A family penicillin-binding protein [Candidatus Colinaster scatohippi]